MDSIPLVIGGEMKSLMWLLGAMLTDVSIRCGTDTHRDLVTVSRRIKHEGDSFLTITLPTFATGFERALERGWVDPKDFRAFKHGKSRVSPTFLSGALDQVFDPKDGSLLANPSIDAIFCVRQFCLAWKKILLPCSDERNRSTIDEYVKTEASLETVPGDVDDPKWITFLRVGRILSGSVCSGAEWDLLLGRGRPRHGPGVTYEGLLANCKYDRRCELPGRQDRIFSSLGWYYLSDPGRAETGLGVHETSLPGTPVSRSCGYGDWLSHVPSDSSTGDGAWDGADCCVPDPSTELPVRITLVPKTLKAPRIIAVEPVGMQYLQQGLLEVLVENLEKNPLTRGHVNFSDQGVNRSLALASSKDGKYATLDLSEASDRVHKDVVYQMLGTVPYFRDLVFACRSTTAELPDGSLLPLYKFASMGSALCFPIEAMVFYSIIVSARISQRGLRPTISTIRKMSRDVYVYGDDLIVPVDEVPTVIDWLEAFGLKVNRHKSFWNGKFRESCGVDAYDGVPVQPVYIRRMPPRSRQDAAEIVSYVALANQFYDAGMWVTARRVREYIESLIGFELPHVLETSPGLGWISASSTYSIQGWDRSHQKPLIRTLVARPSTRSDPLDGWGALLKFFLKRGEDPLEGKHLERSVRRGSANIVTRWVPPY